MTGASAVSATADTLVTAYEELRRGVLAGRAHGGSGLALLLRRGTRAWIEAWTTWAPAAARSTQPALVAAVADDVRVEIVTVLAAMALAGGQAA